MVSDDRLQNWAHYVAWGHIGPEIRTQAASAEGNYQSDDVFEGQDPRYEPDILDGELLENNIRLLPELSRRILKARYVSYPYHRLHTVAQKLKISVDRLESELLIAKRRLYDRLQRNSPRFGGVVTGEAGVCNSQQG